jgi:hypothetical protein
MTMFNLFTLAVEVGAGAAVIIPTARAAWAQATRRDDFAFRVVKWIATDNQDRDGVNIYRGAKVYIAQRWGLWGWINIRHHATLCEAEEECQRYSKSKDGLEVVAEFQLNKNPEINTPRLTKG